MTVLCRHQMNKVNIAYLYSFPSPSLPLFLCNPPKPEAEYKPSRLSCHRSPLTCLQNQLDRSCAWSYTHITGIIYKWPDLCHFLKINVIKLLAKNITIDHFHAVIKKIKNNSFSLTPGFNPLKLDQDRYCRRSYC